MICVLFLVCETPVPAQANAVTIPATALTDQFLAGDSFMYSCNGALVPNTPDTNMCSGTGTWSITATANLPTCSKFFINTVANSPFNLCIFLFHPYAIETSALQRGCLCFAIL